MNREQLIERRSFLGASETGTLLGLSIHGHTPAQLWLEKTSDAEPEEEVDTPAQKRGKYLERAAAECYQDEQGVQLWTIAPRVHPTIEFLRASADRVVRHPTEADKIVRGWEGKSIASHLAYLFGDEGTDEVAPPYLVQCQQNMMCYDVPVWDLTAIVGGRAFEFRHYRVHRNAKLEQTIIDTAADFWKYVTTRTPPDADYWQDRADILKRLHPKSLGMVERIESHDLERTSLVMSLKDAYAAAKEADDRLEHTKTLVKAVIGDNDAIQGPDWTVSWKSSADSRRTDWEGVARAASASEELIAQFTKIVPGPRKFGPPNWTKGFDTALSAAAAKAKKALT